MSYKIWLISKKKNTSLNPIQFRYKSNSNLILLKYRPNRSQMLSKSIINLYQTQSKPIQIQNKSNLSPIQIESKHGFHNGQLVPLLTISKALICRNLHTEISCFKLLVHKAKQEIALWCLFREICYFKVLEHYWIWIPSWFTIMIRFLQTIIVTFHILRTEYLRAFVVSICFTIISCTPIRSFHVE